MALNIYIIKEKVNKGDDHPYVVVDDKREHKI